MTKYKLKQKNILMKKQIVIIKVIMKQINLKNMKKLPDKNLFIVMVQQLRRMKSKNAY